MYLIAGLGNPGKEYDNTRHNVGFMAIDVISEEWGIPMRQTRHRAIVGLGQAVGQKVILAKPQTYMNRSGESIREIAEYYKLDHASQILVICDDINLELGQLRLRAKGSAGGHNGLKDIIANLGDDAFPRLRIGVGGKPEHYDLVNYVLGHFDETDRRAIQESAREAARAAEMFLEDGLEAAMNRFNQKKRTEKKLE